MSWTAREIVTSLQDPAPDLRPVMRELQRDAPPAELAAALAQAPDAETRHLLCDIAGFAVVLEAVDPLVVALADADVGVRSSAADALGKVARYPGTRATHADRARILAALVERLGIEQDPAPLSTILQSIALTGDATSAPLLEPYLTAEDSRVSGQARWGLDYLARGTASTAD